MDFISFQPLAIQKRAQKGWRGFDSQQHTTSTIVLFTFLKFYVDSVMLYISLLFYLILLRPVLVDTCSSSLFILTAILYSIMVFL